MDKRRMRRRLREILGEALALTATAALLSALVIAWLFYGDGGTAEAEERRYYISGDYYYTDYEVYQSAVAAQEAARKEEAALDAEEAEKLKESAEEYQAEQETAAARAFAARNAEDDAWYETDEAGILMRLAMAEAEGEDTEGKALVMLVVLNRVTLEEFPDSIAEVVMQDGQFETVSDGGRYWTAEPDDGCAEALEMVRDGWDESGGALYFESVYSSSAWHSENLEYLFREGNHLFYK